MEDDTRRTDTGKEDGKNDRASDNDKPASVDGNLRRLSGPTRRSSKANWTEEEDEILSDAVKKYEGKSWKKIAGCLLGRTDVQCLHRWQKVLNPDLVKGSWSKKEDSLLVELVGKYGEKKWSEIAEKLPGRMGKQCRERWYNHLIPDINKAAWTDEEERILINAHAEYGNKWSILAKLLPGRTENSVKNHWNCSLNKRLCNNSACGSAVNHPRVTIPPLQANSNRVTRDSTEANQTLSTTSLCMQTVDSGSNTELRSLDPYLGYPAILTCHPSASCKERNSLRPLPSTSKILNYGNTAKMEVQGCASLDENDPCHVTHKPPLVCSVPPETSLQYSLTFPDSPDKACSNRDNLESSSEWPYTGLCYEPIQTEDLNIFRSTGRFPSTESYIRQPRSIYVPPPGWHMREQSDSYRIAKSILRKAAMSYRNMPSIIRKSAIQLLHKGVSAPDNAVSPLSRATAGHEAAKEDEDQVHTCIFLSQMSEGLKSLQPLNLWGFEQEFRDA